MNETTSDEQRREYLLKYYEKNREKRNAYQYAWKAKNPEKWKANQRKAALKRKFGITVEEYERFMVLQDRKCKICKMDGQDTLAVDHDHKTGKIRGLLCGECNMGLGKFKDDPLLLEAAIEYLKSVI